MLAGPRSTPKIARKLRKEMSWPEVTLWNRLRQRPGGFKFRRQHPAGPYILDFFCSAANLAIEIDSFSHETSGQPRADARRDQWLQQRGVRTLRVNASDVTHSTDEVVEWVLATCAERAQPLHQPAAGLPPRNGEEI